MIDYRFYSFADDLTGKVLQDHSAENAVFVFPTERSKKEALRQFQKSWSFTETLFQTMEEFKESLFVSNSPLLREERRNIVLYHALTDAQRREMRIENYLQFIGFASDFFTFWEELSEEEIEPDECLGRFSDDGDEVLEWQSRLYGTMLDIRKNYRRFLNEGRGSFNGQEPGKRESDRKTWTDRIFLFSGENLTYDFYDGYRRFIFVNQHYYTKLENRLLKSLEEKGFAVTVCYQIPEQFIDKRENRLVDKPSFPVSDMKDRNTEQVGLYIARNDFSMYRKFLEILAGKPDLQYIFDSRFYRSSYPRFLSTSLFSGVDKEPVLNCRLSVFLSCLAELLESIFSEKTLNRELIPLNILIKLLSEETFFSYFEPDAARRTVMLRLLNQYLRQDIRYFDTGLKFCEILSRKSPAKKKEEWDLLKELIEKINTLLSKIAEVKSIGSFISLIDREEGLDLNRLLSPEERKFSDIPETFYSALAEFSNIEELGVINNGQFWQEGRKTNNYTVCSGILQLFLLYLRPKRNRWYYAHEKSRRDISSLMDSRNLKCEQCAVLNVTEGILPGSRSTPFLFTEVQRRKLGLKTYEDIRCWEKYYFFRLILNSRRVFLFAQRNDAKNTEISSFIEELKLIFREEELIIKADEVIEDEGYTAFYRQTVRPDTGYLTDKAVLKDPAFYSLPFEPARDLPDRRLVLSYSSYSVLKESPFSYFLKHICRIDEEYEYIPFSPRLTGTIAHQIIYRIWQIISIPAAEDLAQLFRQIPEQVGGILKQSRGNIPESEELYYKIPHTYNLQYFKEVFLPIVEEGIVDFFAELAGIIKGNSSQTRFFHELPGEECSLPLFPKTQYGTAGDFGFDVYLKGRADLIISRHDEQARHKTIIDYKTGKLTNTKELVTQLIIYELIFHYLGEERGKSLVEPSGTFFDTESVSSYIYSLSERKMMEFGAKADKEEKIREFLEEVTCLLKAITCNGWIGSAARPKYFLFPEIVRLDLLKKNIPVDRLLKPERGE